MWMFTRLMFIGKLRNELSKKTRKELKMVQHVSIRLKDRNTVEVVVDGNKIDGISYYKVEESVDQPTEVTLFPIFLIFPQPEL